MRFNWQVLIRCVDCATEYKVKTVFPSIDIPLNAEGKPTRPVMCVLPNSCPSCRNIRRVG